MKKLLLLIAATVALALPASAQVPTYFNNTAWSGGIFAVGISNIASPVFMDVRKQGNISLAITARGTAAVTNILTFGWSNDGSTFTTNAPDTVTWAPDSISTFSTTRITNIPTGGRGYLVLFNNHATIINTNTLTYTTKISAP